MRRSQPPKKLKLPLMSKTSRTQLKKWTTQIRLRVKHIALFLRKAQPSQARLSCRLV